MVGEKEGKEELNTNMTEIQNRQQADNTNGQVSSGGNKMFIQIIIDNSATMKGEKIEKFGEALTEFGKVLESEGLPSIEYSIVLFDILRSKVSKKFSDIKLPAGRLSASGIPILNKAVDLTMDNLELRVKQANKDGAKIFKPWLVLLTDGKNFGDMNSVTERLKTAISNGILTYFPFQLSNNDVDESLNDLYKLKRPLVIIQNKYSELFSWILSTARARVAISIDQAFLLDPKAFEGWIKK